MNNKAVIWILVILAVVASTYLYFTRGDNTVSGQVICATDTKLCLDGSYVSRIAPSCDFASCPVVSGTVTAPAVEMISSPADLYK